MRSCPQDCVVREYRRLPIRFHDIPNLLLLTRPVQCVSCGARFYRPIRRRRSAVGIALVLCLLAGLSWIMLSRDASLSDFKESMSRLLLRIRS